MELKLKKTTLEIGKKHDLTFWLFLTPVLIAFFSVIIIPFFIGVYYSFTDWNATSPDANWIGFQNYANIFSTGNRGAEFLYSVIITTLYSLFNLITINVVSFGLALLVTRGLKFQNFYRIGFFLPNLIGGLILGYLWKFIFNSVFPTMTEAFGWATDSMLINPTLAVIAISITWAWQYAGYIMMIYVTAIQNIPQDLIEAGKIDGANGLQRLRHITLPMVAPAFTVTLFLTLINSFKQFDINYALTGGGPATQFLGYNIFASRFIPMQIYVTYTSGVRGNPALAQAQAVVFFFILTLLSVLQVIANKRKEIEA
jgi:raffinose/stachyose/melibiose transport system permease protein